MCTQTTLLAVKEKNKPRNQNEWVNCIKWCVRCTQPEEPAVHSQDDLWSRSPGVRRPGHHLSAVAAVPGSCGVITSDRAPGPGPQAGLCRDRLTKSTPSTMMDKTPGHTCCIPDYCRERGHRWIEVDRKPCYMCLDIYKEWPFLSIYIYT